MCALNSFAVLKPIFPERLEHKPLAEHQNRTDEHPRLLDFCSCKVLGIFGPNPTTEIDYYFGVIP